MNIKFLYLTILTLSLGLSNAFASVLEFKAECSNKDQANCSKADFNPSSIGGLQLFLSDELMIEVEKKDIEEIRYNDGEAHERESLYMRFSDKKAKALANLTKNNINKRLAVIINGKVISAPLVMQEITKGEVHITSGFGKSIKDEFNHPFFQGLMDQEKNDFLDMVKKAIDLGGIVLTIFFALLFIVIGFSFRKSKGQTQFFNDTSDD